MKRNNLIFSNLKKNGYVIIKNQLSEKKCNNIKNHLIKLKNKIDEKKFNHNLPFGQLTIRDLVLRDTKNYIKFIDYKPVMNILKKVFKDEFILENCMASCSMKPTKKFKRPIHIDSHLPIKEFENTTDIVAIFCLDDFTSQNGSTRIWPKTHKSGKRAQNLSKINPDIKYKILAAKKGSIIIFLGQLWHQIGENTSNEDRWSIFSHYKRWWIKPSTDFTKCGEKIFKMLNYNQKKLFGFNCITPKFNLKNKSRKAKTLRDISKIKNEYKKIINY